jgi:hypothetical protein
MAMNANFLTVEWKLYQEERNEMTSCCCGQQRLIPIDGTRTRCFPLNQSGVNGDNWLHLGKALEVRLGLSADRPDGRWECVWPRRQGPEPDGGGTGLDHTYNKK